MKLTKNLFFHELESKWKSEWLNERSKVHKWSKQYCTAPVNEEVVQANEWMDEQMT